MIAVEQVRSFIITAGASKLLRVYRFKADTLCESFTARPISPEDDRCEHCGEQHSLSHCENVCRPYIARIPGHFAIRSSTRGQPCTADYPYRKSRECAPKHAVAGCAQVSWLAVNRSTRGNHHFGGRSARGVHEKCAVLRAAVANFHCWPGSNQSFKQCSTVHALLKSHAN